jgi:hypothetical protein
LNCPICYMSKEHSTTCFTFTERENLYDQISHSRFMALVMQPDVDIHEIQESMNSFGEYLFVTVSCRTEQPKKLYTFWGLGYHDHRERWIVDTWQWYESHRKQETLPVLEKDEAHRQITERETFVRANITPTEQSPQAKLYEILADLTDEDGALSELEDLGWMFLSDEDTTSE